LSHRLESPSNRKCRHNVKNSIFEFIMLRLSRDLFAKNETIFFFIIFSSSALSNCITMQHFKKKIIRFNTQFMSTNSTTKSLHVLASQVKNSSRYSILTSWLDSNTWYQHRDPNRLFDIKILTRPRSWRAKNLARTRWFDPTRSI